ncbi:hybrid-cluster NAD(P)-dependent oxidoreductase [Marinimicrococcus flavescens]|uniref:Hybrid-cluster NAD(P)-dependent oxidoreductase n=1 Tax=Marinimicrococcus flavescens TaxID=3031815 RepID=A0AAP3V0Y7_9PROT|nr:hybrid-cluster NAD(P)-dependent oxidoreductase [Marinimicrococcus flavescens]
MSMRHRLLLDALWPAWDCEEDDRLICRAVYDETHDVKTFLFASPEPRQFIFAPGQFLTFDFPVGEGGQGEGSVNRCYTIASSPTRPHTVAITVKRTSGGSVSNWLHDNIKVGDVVRAIGPMGEFSTWAHPCSKRLFLSGGVGATPLMSHLRRDFDMGEDLDTIVVHCARTPRDILFRHELDLMAHRRQHLQIAHLVESVDGEQGWAGYRGRISRELVEMIAPDYREREIFCCGPPPFMAAVRAILRQGGYDMSRYHEESFDFADLAPAEQAAAPPPPDAGVKVHSVTFKKSGQTIECDENTTILAAARMAGLRLPSSCTKGLCGTCKTLKLSGEVEMAHAGGIRQREIDRGMVLLCCSKPRGEVTVDR